MCPKLFVALSCLLFSTLDTQAGERILKYEKLLGFQNVTITKVTPSEIRIIHKGGITSIQFEDLPQPVRDNLGLTQNAADKYRVQLAMKQRKRALQLKQEKFLKSKRVAMTGTVSQVLENGVLLTDVVISDGSKIKKKIPYRVKVGGPTALNPDRKPKTVTRYRIEWIPARRRLNHEKIFVECSTSGFVDGSTFGEAVYSFSTFTYHNVLGAPKTVPAFTTDPKAVLKKHGLLE